MIREALWCQCEVGTTVSACSFRATGDDMLCDACRDEVDRWRAGLPPKWDNERHASHVHSRRPLPLADDRACRSGSAPVGARSGAAS